MASKTKTKTNTWFSVTPLSKAIAVILFISLPILSFLWGINVGFDMHQALSTLAVETVFIR